MAAVTLRGVITEICPVEYVGDNKMAKQTFILFVPGYKDQFDVKKGVDEDWQISAVGEKVPGFELTQDKVGKVVDCKFYINSKRVTPLDRAKPDMFIINNTLHSYQVVK